jgi:hypothetical protein
MRDAPFAPRNQAHLESVRDIATETQLKPVGMAIGPFSLMTKLMADPITAVAMAGAGVTAEEDDGAVLNVERCLALAEAAVARSWCASQPPIVCISPQSRSDPGPTFSSVT